MNPPIVLTPDQRHEIYTALSVHEIDASPSTELARLKDVLAEPSVGGFGPITVNEETPAALKSLARYCIDSRDPEIRHLSLTADEVRARVVDTLKNYRAAQ